MAEVRFLALLPGVFGTTLDIRIHEPLGFDFQVARVNAPWVRSDLTSGNRLLLIGHLHVNMGLAVLWFLQVSSECFEVWSTVGGQINDWSEEQGPWGLWTSGGRLIPGETVQVTLSLVPASDNFRDVFGLKQKSHW